MFYQMNKKIRGLSTVIVASSLFLSGCSVLESFMGESDENAQSEESTDSTESSVAETTTSEAKKDQNAEGEYKTESSILYPANGSDNNALGNANVLGTLGIQRSDITTSIGNANPVPGVPLKVRLKIMDMKENKPMSGAAVYIWHGNADGFYSVYPPGLEQDTFLRGVQTTNNEGIVEFTTIVPGVSDDRWPHINFEVYPDINSLDHTKALLTSSFLIPKDIAKDVYTVDSYLPFKSLEKLNNMRLENDVLFSDGWDLQMPKVTGNNFAGYTFDIEVPIDKTTPNTDFSSNIETTVEKTTEEKTTVTDENGVTITTPTPEPSSPPPAPL